MNVTDLATYVFSAIGAIYAARSIVTYLANNWAYRKFKARKIDRTHNIKLGAVPPKQMFVPVSPSKSVEKDAVLNAARELKSIASATKSPFILLLKDTQQKGALIITQEGDDFELVRCISEATDESKAADEFMQIITKYYHSKYTN